MYVVNTLSVVKREAKSGWVVYMLHIVSGPWSTNNEQLLFFVQKCLVDLNLQGIKESKRLIWTTMEPVIIWAGSLVMPISNPLTPVLCISRALIEMITLQSIITKRIYFVQSFHAHWFLLQM